jgi:F-type H+-transporting ATPase subunit a
VDKPGALQHVFEGAHGLSKVRAGNYRTSQQGFSLPCDPDFFILICNLIGLIPGFESPTAVPSSRWDARSAPLCTTRPGVQHHGIAYLKHFMGPMWWLAVIMVPIEIISHLARMLSLTVRLYANMFAGDMVTMVFFSLVPIGVPIIFLGLHIGVSLLQTYIFVLLTMVYLSGAVAEEH